MYIDKGRAGGEPVSVVAQDGSIIVSAHAGTTHLYKNPMAALGVTDFAVDYWNQTLNWRSSDGGKTWKFVGLLGAPVGPHSPTSTGFSDPDLTMDASGRIYNTEIDLANIAVYSSTDDGQSWPFANPEIVPGDRPWLLGQQKDEVFLYVRTPELLLRSTNGGITFTLQNDGPNGGGGKPLNDPLNPKHGIILPTGDGGVLISKNDGQSFKTFPGTLPGGTQFFPAAAVDRAGWIYSASAGGYTGSDDNKSDGKVAFSYFNRKSEKWSAPITIPTPDGDALWPWLAAGDNGRAAVTWYQSIAGEPNKFYIYVAYTTNAHGSVVRCSDGSTKRVPPTFDVVNASGRPIHVGKICLSGTTCNLNTGEGGDRRLGDFFTINFDHKGNIFVVSGDTMLNNLIGGPKVVANPIFIKQSSGNSLLVKPDKVRKTRCLFNLPAC
jgi:hypothetical protein